MKRLAAALLISSAATALAAAPPSSDQSQIAADLTKQAAQTMVESQDQSASSSDPDQGDDHAALRAIEVVCSKDNPAAQRSAICPVPNSPG